MDLLLCLDVAHDYTCITKVTSGCVAHLRHLHDTGPVIVQLCQVSGHCCPRSIEDHTKIVHMTQLLLFTSELHWQQACPSDSTTTDMSLMRCMWGIPNNIFQHHLHRQFVPKCSCQTTVPSRDMHTVLYCIWLLDVSGCRLLMFTPAVICQYIQSWILLICLFKTKHWGL